MAKRPPPSEATREKNRKRELERYRKMRSDPAFCEKENRRLAAITKKRRADPEYRAKERKMTAARMRLNRRDPVYLERSREVVRICHERHRVNRQFDAFMRQLEDAEQ